MFDLNACHVERNLDGDYEIRWATKAPGQRVSVYMSDDAEFFYRGEHPGAPVLQTSDRHALLSNPDKAPSLQKEN